MLGLKDIETPRSGRILYVDGRTVIASDRDRLLRSMDGGDTWKTVFKSSMLGGIKKHRLVSRLLRAGFYHCVPVRDSYFAVVSKQTITFDSGFEVKHVGALVGSRPLKICITDSGDILYGEYRPNKVRSPIYVWKSSDKGVTWNRFLEVPSVRHVHGVFDDPYSNSKWITTGDNDDESRIIMVHPEIDTVTTIVSGSQMSRAVDLAFTETAVYFGSDTPREQNSILKLDRKTNSVTNIGQVNGSVFHACKVNDNIFFSTAVEPSDVNIDRNATLWRVDKNDRLSKVVSARKDRYHMKFFQYGQLFFPAGPGDGKNVWFSTFATQDDHRIFRLPLSQLEVMP